MSNKYTKELEQAREDAYSAWVGARSAPAGWAAATSYWALAMALTWSSASTAELEYQIDLTLEQL